MSEDIIITSTNKEDKGYFPGEIQSCPWCHITYPADGTTWHKVRNQEVCHHCFTNGDTCAHCGDIRKRGRMTRYNADEKPICLQCAEAYYTPCADCGYYHLSDDIEEIETLNRYGDRQRKKVCNGCVEEYYNTCNDCGISIHRDSTYNYDDSYFCSSCWNERFFCCRRCGDTHPHDDARIIDDSYYCESCANRVESEDIIRGYSYKPTPRFFGGDSRKHRFYGTELEIECDRNDEPFEIAQKVKDIIGDWAYMKEDGSLSNGIEIVTHPMTLDFHRSEFPWKELLSILSRNKCKSHDVDTCGLHIHTNKNVLPNVEQIKLAILVNNNIEIMTKISRRNPNHYAKYKDVSREKTRANYSRDRYEAINFQNRRTVEFRSFKGTLKFESLIASIEATDALIRTVKTLNVNQVLKPEAFRTFANIAEEYTFLPQYLADKKVFDSAFTTLIPDNN